MFDNTLEVASKVGYRFLNLFRMPFMIMIDPAITNPYKEEAKKVLAKCLLDRETGNCVY